MHIHTHTHMRTKQMKSCEMNQLRWNGTRALNLLLRAV